MATGSSLTLANGGWTGNGSFTKTGAGAMSVGANAGDRFTIDSTRGGGFNMAAGTFTVTGTAYFVMGDVGNATYNQTDGTFTLSASNGGYIGNGTGSNSTMNITGGTFIQTVDRMRIGQAASSVGRMNIGSGASLATVTTPSINFSENSSGAQGYLNLSTNGLLNVGKISKGAGAGTISFDGGTLAGDQQCDRLHAGPHDGHDQCRRCDHRYRRQNHHHWPGVERSHRQRRDLHRRDRQRLRLSLCPHRHDRRRHRHPGHRRGQHGR